MKSKNKFVVTYPDGTPPTVVPERLPNVQKAIAASPSSPAASKVKVINLPCYSIRVKDEGGEVTVTSSLRAIITHLEEETVIKMKEFAIETIESLIASHYQAGVKIASKAYVAGIEDAVSNLRKGK